MRLPGVNLPYRHAKLRGSYRMPVVQKNSDPIWSLRLHPKPLTLPLTIHDASTWHVGIWDILGNIVSNSIVGESSWSSSSCSFSLAFLQHSASRDACWRVSIGDTTFPLKSLPFLAFQMHQQIHGKVSNCRTLPK